MDKFNKYLEPLIIALLLPVAVFPRASTIWLLLLLPCVWAWQNKRGQILPITPLNTALLGLLLMVLVSTAVTPDLPYSIGKVIGVTYGVAVYFAAVRYGQLQQLLILHNLSALGIIGLGLLFGLWRLPYLDQLLASVPNLMGEAINTNQIAGVLTWIVPLPLAITMLAFIEKRWKTAVPLTLLTLFFITILLLTRSRGALLGVAIAFVCMALLLFVPQTRQRWAGLAGLTIAGLALLWLVGSNLTLANNADTTFNTLQGRMDIWTRGLYGLRDFPITGMGMNIFRRAMPILYPSFMVPATKDVAHAHNQFIQAGLDLGLLGLLAYIAIWVISAHMLWQRWQTAPQKEWLVGLAGCLIAHFVYGMLDAVTLGAKPGMIFWLLLACITLLHKQSAPTT